MNVVFLQAPVWADAPKTHTDSGLIYTVYVQWHVAEEARRCSLPKARLECSCADLNSKGGLLSAFTD